MEIKTKFDVGQPVYFINCHNGQCRVELEKIEEIHIGGNINDAYKFRICSRSESGVFTDFNLARVECIKQQEKENLREIENCKKQLEPHL